MKDDCQGRGSFLTTGLLLPPSRFSRVRLCATPWTAAHQAPPSLGFSRQEHWSGLPFPSPMQESEKGKWKGKVKSLSHVWLLATQWTAAYQAPPSMGFSRQEYWSGVPLPFLQHHCRKNINRRWTKSNCDSKVNNKIVLIIKIHIAQSPLGWQFSITLRKIKAGTTGLEGLNIYYKVIYYIPYIPCL